MAGPVSTKSAKEKTGSPTKDHAGEQGHHFLKPSSHAAALAWQRAAGNQATSQLMQQSISGPGTAATQAPPLVAEVLRAPGQQLEPNTRRFMEARFGRDFSRVRVHKGEKAGQAARAIGAKAYTAGQHIVVGTEPFTPNCPAGIRLLAHELAHVAQVNSVSSTTPQVAPPSTQWEADAHRAALEVSQGHSYQVIPGAPASIHRLLIDPFDRYQLRKLKIIKKVIRNPINIRNMGREFFTGLAKGYRGKAGEKEAAALEKRFQAAIKIEFPGGFPGLPWFPISIKPAVGAGLIAGTFVGIVEGLYYSLKSLAKIITEIDQIEKYFLDFVDFLFTPGSEQVVHAIGQHIGENSAEYLKKLVRQDDFKFGFEIGKLIGPVLADIILFILTRGAALIGRLAGITKIVGLLKRIPKFKALLHRLEEFGRSARVVRGLRSARILKGEEGAITPKQLPKLGKGGGEVPTARVKRAERTPAGGGPGNVPPGGMPPGGMKITDWFQSYKLTKRGEEVFDHILETDEIFKIIREEHGKLQKLRKGLQIPETQELIRRAPMILKDRLEREAGLKFKLLKTEEYYRMFPGKSPTELGGATLQHGLPGTRPKGLKTIYYEEVAASTPISMWYQVVHEAGTRALIRGFASYSDYPQALYRLSAQQLKDIFIKYHVSRSDNISNLIDKIFFW